MTLDQLFFMRPVAGWAKYRTPIEALYLCGSGTHPGGGVMGASGFNAAREVLSDWRGRKLAWRPDPKALLRVSLCVSATRRLASFMVI